MQGDQQGDDEFRKEVQEVMRQHTRPKAGGHTSADSGGITVTGEGNQVHYHAAPTEPPGRLLGLLGWALVLTVVPVVTVLAASQL